QTNSRADIMKKSCRTCCAILHPSKLHRQSSEYWFEQITASRILHRALGPELYLQAVVINLNNIPAEDGVANDAIDPDTIHCSENGIIIHVKVQFPDLHSRQR